MSSRGERRAPRVLIHAMPGCVMGEKAGSSNYTARLWEGLRLATPPAESKSCQAEAHESKASGFGDGHLRIVRERCKGILRHAGKCEALIRYPDKCVEIAGQ